MNDGHWGLFPYPTLKDGVVTDGSLIPAHPICASCSSRPCENGAVGEPGVCRFGFTYVRVDESRLIVGLADPDNMTSKKARKRVREHRDRHVRQGQLRAVLEQVRALGPGIADDFATAQVEALRRISEDPVLHRSVAEHLRKESSETLNQSHDFMQLVKLVRGHAEELLRARRPDLEPSRAAELFATEGSIFFSTELMLAKMDSLTYLRESNLAFGSEKSFHIHPLVLKYVRIYQWQARQKNVTIRLKGECYSASYYNPSAISTVVHALLDNLVKYAPPGSEAEILFSDEGTEITVRFSSIGPRISSGELDKIFLPSYRGLAARELESTGLGVGLASARAISDTLGLDIGVQQDVAPETGYPDRYRTIFSLRLVRDREAEPRG